LFDQELDRILRELRSTTEDSTVEKYREARRISEMLIHHGEFDPI
jgi:hypothetical protein